MTVIPPTTSDERLADAEADEVEALRIELARWRQQWDDLEKTFAWRTLLWLRRLRHRLAPNGSRRELAWLSAVRVRSAAGPSVAIERGCESVLAEAATESALSPELVDTIAVNDAFITIPPSPQNALDLFRGEWSSAFPAPLSDLRAGAVRVFEDARIDWAVEQLGGVEGQSVLELGPLEGGHSYMLEQFGARKVTAIEANSRAYLKCLIAKELLRLQRVEFLLGDFMAYLSATDERFDAVIASGVLYHMPNPVELIALLSNVTDRIFIWTHYFDADVIAAEERLATKFSGKSAAEYDGFRHTLHRYHYGEALGWQGFCGGTVGFTHWLCRQDLLAAIGHFGFNDIRIEFDHPHHPNGPALALVAMR